MKNFFSLLLLLMANSIIFSAEPIATRIPGNPLITPLSGKIGSNINGPSVIKVPKWVKRPLGKYYMYFAHHNGKYIRLAYADKPEGPWKIYKKGCLDLKDVRKNGYKGHIASPDVHVDEKNKRIIMYFHSPHSWPKEAKGRLRTKFKQLTGIATSRNGLDFKTEGSVPLAFSYLRVFSWNNTFYGITARGLVFKWDGKGWPDGSKTMIERKHPLQSWRHCSVNVNGDRLFVFYSRWGDKPERIVAGYVELNKNWDRWKISEPVPILKPETPEEGTELPLKKSTKGAAKIRLNELRDPCYFEDNGKHYLFYSIAGESGISCAVLNPDWKKMIVDNSRNSKKTDPPDK